MVDDVRVTVATDPRAALGAVRRRCPLAGPLLEVGLAPWRVLWRGGRALASAWSVPDGGPEAVVDPLRAVIGALVPADPDEDGQVTLDRVASCALEAIGARAVVVLRSDEAGWEPVAAAAPIPAATRSAVSARAVRLASALPVSARGAPVATRQLPGAAAEAVAGLGIGHVAVAELRRPGGERFGAAVVLWDAGGGRRAVPTGPAALDLVVAVLAAGLERTLTVDGARERALHDPLTGLANRQLFADRVDRALASARRRDRSVAVCYLDLDGFKDVNDTLGHEIGDAVLRRVADRLRETVRAEDGLARLGGDEFAVLLPEVPDPASAVHVARKVAAAVAVPVEVGRYRLAVTPSVGVAVHPHDGADRDELLRHADLAMYRAKANGRGRVVRFTDDLARAAERAVGFVDELRRAIETGGLELRYQPQVAVADGEVVAVEALVRWTHPTLGLLHPHEFLRTAEETGLVVAVDTWVLARAARDVRSWRREGVVVPRLAVNVVAVDLADPAFPGAVAAICEHTGLAPGDLELEIHEDVPAAAGGAVRAGLAELRRRGTRLAIDDFGTRPTVIAHLSEVSIDTIKLDGSLLGGPEPDERPSPVLDGLVALGRTLGARLVAEGVESPAQRDRLVRSGCDALQGHLVAPPLTADELRDWLRARAGR